MIEYEACIISLKAVLELKIGKLDVYRDSMLIICQVKRKGQTKNEKLRSYQNYLLKLASEFDKIKFTHMRIDKN